MKSLKKWPYTYGHAHKLGNKGNWEKADGFGENHVESTYIYIYVRRISRRISKTHETAYIYIYIYGAYRGAYQKHTKQYIYIYGAYRGAYHQEQHGKRIYIYGAYLAHINYSMHSGAFQGSQFLLPGDGVSEPCGAYPAHIKKLLGKALGDRSPFRSSARHAARQAASMQR